ncbi:interleukin-26 [Ascaphus truei]|uniref:interleukin-26 n=1 Tax=Ascaphus truei TaxID=8439 RepID=UPI003F592FDB
MKIYCSLVPMLFLISLLPFTCESKKMPIRKCPQKSRMKKDIENLYKKTEAFKSLFPTDHIKGLQLLTKDVEKDFMENCNVRYQLLSFYLEVFGNNKVKGKAGNIIEGFVSMQDNLQSCAKCVLHSNKTESMTELFKKFPTRNINGRLWKAISELDILIIWIKDYLRNLQ